MFKKVIGLCLLCLLYSQYAYAQFCFIGDSRFVGMQQAIDDDRIQWIAKVSMGNSWVWSHMDEITFMDKDTILVYEMGVNDLDAKECIKVLSYLKEQGFTHVYFTEVTPVSEGKAYSYGYNRSNAQIEEYNQHVLNNLPSGVKKLDCYNHFITNGFDTLDGIHYTDSTSKMWYQYIYDKIDEDLVGKRQIEILPISITFLEVLKRQDSFSIDKYSFIGYNMNITERKRGYPWTI